MYVAKNIKLLIIFQFLVEFRLYAALAVIYFASITGSFALAMGVLSTIMIASAVLEIPTGVFSDLIGRKNTVILGSLASVVFVFFYAFGGNIWWLTIGAVFEGLSRSLWSGNNEALMYESVDDKNKDDLFSKYSGYCQSAGQAALAIASLLGGIIAIVSINLAFWITIIPQVIACFVALMLVEPKRHSSKESNIFAHLSTAFNQFKHNYKLRLISFASIISFAFGETGFQFRPVFVNSLWPIWAVGLSQTLSFIGGSISFYFSGLVIKKIGALKSLVVEKIISSLINILSLLYPSILSPAFLTATSLFYGVSQTAKSTLMQREFTKEQRATLGSINSLAASIAFAVVSFALGYVADQIGPIKALIITHVILLLPLWIYWKLFTHNKKAGVTY